LNQSKKDDSPRIICDLMKAELNLVEKYITILEDFIKGIYLL